MVEADPVIKALMEAKKKFKPLIKDKNNPFFKSKYADLPQVYDAVTEPLNEHGFVVLQPTSRWPDGVPYIHTKILHVTGREFVSTYDLPTGLDAQKMAAAVTYGKRVALCALLSLASDDDNDGEEALGRNQRPAPPAHRQAPHKPATKPPEPLVVPDSGPFDDMNEGPASTKRDKAKADGYMPEQPPIEVPKLDPEIAKIQEQVIGKSGGDKVPEGASVMLVLVNGFNPNPRPVGTSGSMSYSIKVLDLDGDGEEQWASTFNRDAWETAKLLKGQHAHLTYKLNKGFLNFYHIEKAE